jgi:hypothetical protein
LGVTPLRIGPASSWRPQCYVVMSFAPAPPNGLMARRQDLDRAVVESCASRRRASAVDNLDKLPPDL